MIISKLEAPGSRVRRIGGRAFASASASAFVALVALPLMTNAAAMPAYPAVTQARLNNAGKDNGWLMYRRDYSSQAFAPFDQINTGNVGKLKVAFEHKVNRPGI